MKGYVARKGNRWYAVIYQGLDPVTGREQRRWHAAGTSRADAVKLATRLAAQNNGRNDEARSLTFGAYLVRTWLPGKRLVLAPSTYAGYERNVQRHVLPTLGRIGLRRLGPSHLESLYQSLLNPSGGSAGLSSKTVYEIHLVIRGALTDAVRRGLVPRNIALVARSPRLRATSTPEQRTWTANDLKTFLRAAVGHRLFTALWVLAFTGMRRNELLGLRWDDFDNARATLSVNRGLVAIGYDVHETRGKTRNARRRIDLDPTTVELLATWRHWQRTEQWAIGREPSDRMFTDGNGAAIHPHAISQAFERICRRAGMRVIRLHDLRHTHASLLIAAGVPVKVVSERLGHASPTFTIETYQHVLPGMQADAAKLFEHLVTGDTLLPAARPPVEGRKNRRQKTA